MPPYFVRDLSFSDRAREKLGRRGISETEANQLRFNRPLISPNPRGRNARRWMLHGRTNGGRALVLIVEEDYEPGDWIVITGWEAERGVR